MGNGKIWPSADTKPLNRSSPNFKHVITSRTSTTKKLGVNPPRDFLPPPQTSNIHPKPSNVYFFFRYFRSDSHPIRWIGPIFALNKSNDVDLRNQVPFGVSKFNFNILLIYSTKSKIYKWRLWGNFKKILNCHNSGCMKQSRNFWF